MTQRKHTIIALGILGIFSLGLAYVISINMEMGFCSINSGLISNNFLFTCFTGAFASILVLIATEIHSFRRACKEFDQFLFSQLVLIYGQLQIADKNITKLLNKTDLVPYNLLSMLSNTINQITPSLRSLDYNKFFNTRKSNIITGIINRLYNTEISQMDELFRNCVYLPMAINTDKLNLLNMGNLNPIITSSSPNTQQVLKALYNEISQLESIILFDITELNAVCNNRFHWNEIEKAISNVPTIDNSLEEFISKYK